jgi:hypothetical protein
VNEDDVTGRWLPAGDLVSMECRDATRTACVFCRFGTSPSKEPWRPISGLTVLPHVCQHASGGDLEANVFPALCLRPAHAAMRHAKHMTKSKRDEREETASLTW